MKFSKKTKILISLVIISLAILILGVFLTSSTNHTEKPDMPSSIRTPVLSDTSYPVSTPVITEITDPDPVSWVMLSFETDIKFEDPAISLNFESANLKNIICTDPSNFNPKMQLANYTFGPIAQGLGFADISFNTDRYKDQDITLKSGYDFIDKIMDNEIQASNFKNNSEILEVFGTGCTGARALPIVHFKQVDYPGTEKAFAFILFGSSQSVVNSASPIVQVIVIAKINDNYILLSRFSDYSQKIDFLRSTELLKSCEIKSNSGYPYLPIFTDEGAECTRNAYLKDIDQSAFDIFVSDLISKFRLKLP